MVSVNARVSNYRHIMYYISRAVLADHLEVIVLMPEPYGITASATHHLP